MGDNAPITILEDNQACISVGTKDIVSPKLKHIDIKYHYVRSMVQEGKIKIVSPGSRHPDKRHRQVDLHSTQVDINGVADPEEGC